MPPPATPQHDYIALAELPHAMGRRPGGAHDEEAGEGDSDYDGGLLRETELRLGPPGSGTPRRKEKPPLALELLLPLHKVLASGAKRGFLEAIDGSGRWVFPGGGVGEGDAAKGAGLFSPRGDGAGRQLGGVNQDGGTAASGVAPEKKGQASTEGNDRGGMAPSPKAQVIGWPPIRSYRKNTMAANPTKKGDDAEEKQDSSCLYVKVSMDGAPYLRKIDLKIYSNYKELSTALEKMFSCFTLGQYGSHGMPKRDGLGENKLNDLHRSEYVLTYEDKDGDWMLVGDVPWEMFMGSCRRLRIMKGSDAIGLAPRSTDKSKNRN